MNEMFWFGVIDNGILALVTVGGVLLHGRITFSRKTIKRANTTMAALASAMVGNAASDAVAALSMGLRPTVGVFTGCMAVFMLWPALRDINKWGERINA
jgi:hypothetical protein